MRNQLHVARDRRLRLREARTFNLFQSSGECRLVALRFSHQSAKVTGSGRNEKPAPPGQLELGRAAELDRLVGREFVAV